jgi:hypothetical protein
MLTRWNWCRFRKKPRHVCLVRQHENVASVSGTAAVELVHTSTQSAPTSEVVSGGWETAPLRIGRYGGTNLAFRSEGRQDKRRSVP